MPSITVVTRDGREQVVEAHPSQSVMEAICGMGGGEMQAICFGCCSCATCHVYVEEGGDALPAMSEDEAYVLGGSDHRTAGSRLSCQVRVTAVVDGLRVSIAPEEINSRR